MAMATGVPPPIARAPIHNSEHQCEFYFYFFCKKVLDHMGGHMKGSETSLFSPPWMHLGGRKYIHFKKDSMVVVLQGYGHTLSIVKNIIKGILKRPLMMCDNGLCTSSQK
jgi:hypothetical protein